MNERFLHHVWQHSYFNSNELITTDNEPVQIIHPGTYNLNQGPDFSNARIRIGNTVFAGSVEIHVKSSDWHRHQHTADENYNNVVLHVVYEHDNELGLPEIELKGRIPGQMTERYERMMCEMNDLPCAGSLSKVSELTWLSWKERLVVERLEKRAGKIRELLSECKQHWEETFWWMLAQGFGGNINGASFLLIAKSLPLTVLAKHREQIHQLEAFLFGQAGLLEESPKDKYQELLQREYQFLKKKYGLQPVSCQLYFLRMRPGNFPTIRLAQLAMLMKSSGTLFTDLLQEEKLEKMIERLRVTANDHWHYHYRFGEEGKFLPKRLGKDSAESIMINTAIPALFAYGSVKKEEAYVSKAIRWMQELPGEKNTVTREFERLEITNASSFDSQALIELKKNYCNEKKCLSCAIGNSILKESVRF